MRHLFRAFLIAAVLLVTPVLADDRGSAAVLQGQAHPVATQVPPSKITPGNLPSTPTVTESHDCPQGQYWDIDHCAASPLIHPNKGSGSNALNLSPLPTSGQGGNNSSNQGGSQQTSSGSGGLGSQQGEEQPKPVKVCPQGSSVGLGGFCATPAKPNGQCPQGLKKASDGKCYSKDDYKKIK